jgi:Cu/Ag efflux protein CusF
MNGSTAIGRSNLKGRNRMRQSTKLNAYLLLLIFAITAGMSLCVWIAGCSSPRPAAQQGPSRYSLHGRVVSIDKANQQVVVDHKEIPVFMMAMTMGYAVKDLSLLESLSPEDQITADVVVNGNDRWLENIVVVKKADQTKTPASDKSRPVPPQPGKQ